MSKKNYRIIERLYVSLLDLTPGIRIYLWRRLYNHLANRYQIEDWNFMNYGYADLSENPIIDLSKWDGIPYIYNIHNKTQRSIQDLAPLLNPKIRGWLNYFGRINLRSMRPVFYYLHQRTIKWILNKYKSFKQSKVKAV